MAKHITHTHLPAPSPPPPPPAPRLAVQLLTAMGEIMTVALCAVGVVTVAS